MSNLLGRPSGQHIHVRDDWLERVQESILEPDLPIIDCHHHLWNRPSGRYLQDDYLADVRTGHNILASVYIQCLTSYRSEGPLELRPVGETEFISKIAAASGGGMHGNVRVAAGIVGYADMTLGDKVEVVLEAHVAAGGGRFRGVRHITAWDSDETLVLPAYNPPAHILAQRRFVDALRALGRMQLSFDAWLYHPQIKELIAAAQACPETLFILDHLGTPLASGRYSGQREAIFPIWAQDIKSLARCPNVVVKLGGLGMHMNGFGFERAFHPPSSQTLAAVWRPYIETCIEAFGTARCMFESNFPVDKGSYSYPIFWNACKSITKGMSASERADLFAETARRIYKIGPPSSDTTRDSPL